MSISNRAAAVMVGASMCALLVSCTNTESGQEAAPSSSTNSTSAAAVDPALAPLQKYYTQRVAWEGCDGFDTDGSGLKSDLQCARVTVPLDYDKPDGDTAKIAISKSAASGDRIGSLLMNPGGPGASGLALASQLDDTPLAKRFDVIGFDPRGIGASTPAVSCLTPQEADADRQDLDVDMSPAGIAQTEKEHADYAAKCAQRAGTTVLAHVGTREVVRDMDIIRGVLGDAKLNYVGYSYGTRIGSTYAETFPDRVRAMVLDGAVDPEQNPLDELVAQAAGFQKVFDEYARDCAKNRNCPLGGDAAGAVSAIRALVNPLIDKPAATTDPRRLNYNDAMTGVQQALYSPDLWRVLTVGLRELSEGRGDTLLHLADIYDGRRDDGSYSNLNDAFNAIRCADDPPVKDRAAVGATDVRYRQAAPFLDDGLGTGQAPLDMCAFWPVPNTATPHTLSVPGLPKVVVVSTTEDPATPYQAGVDLARQLNGSLITYQGEQHTVALQAGVACVDDPVTAYLTDLTEPAPGLRC
ncbi:alpha/beta hydrolase [Antrihabitans cavernicola]|uniref:Alpha/beta hydrolase n=1 Tax=Antrihabitans cavernicola TaxID=2495913 RepID=A0A5A7SED9_9NOCA|nr:alpha/beta hydrolase [Spelaeibacter cavernicola]KAA0023067.1 alpha/beta hydrolase [Spelaeibacter cavernicola]